MVVYNYKGRDYCTAICERCGASVTMTMAVFMQMSLSYLDGNMPCCEHPDYYWRPDA